MMKVKSPASRFFSKRLTTDCHILNPKAVTNLNGARFTLFVG
jgi:hypothetical protein